MISNENENDEIDLLEVFFFLKKRWTIILAAGMIMAVLAGLFTRFLMVPVYSSTSKLYILSTSTSLTSLTDIQIGTSLTKDFVQLVQSKPVADKVIANLNLDTNYQELLKHMTFTNPSDTRILVITCQDNNPILAKQIADEFAEVSRIHISEIMKTEAPTIAEYGTVAEFPVSPSMKKNVAVGGLAGIVIACGIFIVLFLMDDTVKTAEDIEKYLGLNTLTAIPLKVDEQKSGKKISFGKKSLKNTTGGEKKNG